MNRHLLFALLLVLCAGCDLSLDAISGYEPAAASEDSPPATTGDARVRISNQYVSSIVAVYISSCSSTSWGTDLLDTTIARNTSRLFGPFRPGCYDLRADALDGKTFVLEGAQLTAGTFTATVN